MSKVTLERVDDYRWRIPRHGGMRVDGLVFASQRMIDDIRADASLEQVRNVAHLPGIVGASLAMPDIHWGYGFPIGGVAAFDPEGGVVSPGGVGYDINCGVRMLYADIQVGEARSRLRELVETLFEAIPSGVGSTRTSPVLASSGDSSCRASSAAAALRRPSASRRRLRARSRKRPCSGPTAGASSASSANRASSTRPSFRSATARFSSVLAFTTS